MHKNDLHALVERCPISKDLKDRFDRLIDSSPEEMFPSIEAALQNYLTDREKIIAEGLSKDPHWKHKITKLGTTLRKEKETGERKSDEEIAEELLSQLEDNA